MLNDKLNDRDATKPEDTWMDRLHELATSIDKLYDLRRCQAPGCGCMNRPVPGLDRCQTHSVCFLCGKPLGDEVTHPAAPAYAGGPVELACNACFQRLMARLPDPGPELLCDGCGAGFGAGCECIENSRAIGRGERSKA